MKWILVTLIFLPSEKHHGQFDTLEDCRMAKIELTYEQQESAVCAYLG
ncbi:MAG: hypothetical protein KAI73_07670 [Rhodospirillaceae bacterium]|nr:hypothetical protein [Rhodospirillaceae bacterium]